MTTYINGYDELYQIYKAFYYSDKYVMTVEGRYRDSFLYWMNMFCEDHSLVFERYQIPQSYSREKDLDDLIRRIRSARPGIFCIDNRWRIAEHHRELKILLNQIQKGKSVCRQSKNPIYRISEDLRVKVILFAAEKKQR